MINLTFETFEFPSPIGVLYILICSFSFLVLGLAVSVPYRGSLYSNRQKIPSVSRLNWVSVPYRGSLYSNRQKILSVSRLNWVSVPYRGSLYSNVIIRFRCLWKVQNSVSVPYRGSLYSNRNLLRYVRQTFVSVPYRGSLYSNPSLYIPFILKA